MKLNKLNTVQNKINFSAPLVKPIMNIIIYGLVYMILLDNLKLNNCSFNKY